MSDKSSNTGVMRLLYSFIAVLGLVLLTVVLTGCGSTVAPSNDVLVSSPKESLMTWDGTWTSDPAFMTAVIEDNVIKINITTQDETDLYWQGTWPAPTKVTDGMMIVSDADTEVLALSLFGSQDPTKAFTYSTNGDLAFKFSMLGVTKTIHLKKG